MKVVLAEKPSVARDIASFLRASSRRDGHFEGGGYQVTWAFGHLAELKKPEGYRPEWKTWSLSAFFKPRACSAISPPVTATASEVHRTIGHFCMNRPNNLRLYGVFRADALAVGYPGSGFLRGLQARRHSLGAACRVKLCRAVGAQEFSTKDCQMKRLLPAIVVAAIAFVFVAEAKAQYPYQAPYGSYGGMNLNLGGGNFYNFGSTPYGPYSGMSLSLGGGNRLNTGSTPYGAYSGMNLSLGGGSYYNTGSFTPYSGSRIGPYRHEHGGYGYGGSYNAGAGGFGYY